MNTTSSKPISIAIVIPAYNEALRLPKTLETLGKLIHNQSFDFVNVKQVVVADDGSGDDTVAVAQQYANQLPNLKVVSDGKNRGKGFAVRHGLESVTEAWALIADADMATPWTEVIKVALPCSMNQADLAFGSRDLSGSEITIEQTPLRELMGRCFNYFVRFITGLPFKDTQCGFKLIRTEKYRLFSRFLKVDGFAYDVELLLAAKRHKLQMREIPIQWEHQDASKVDPIRDGIEMLWAVIKLRFRDFFRARAPIPR